MSELPRPFRARRHVVTTLLALAVSSTGSIVIPRTARADDVPPDEAALRHGIALRKEQRDQEALDEFKRAFATNPTARAQAQMALAEQALGRWSDAEADFTAALASTGDAWIDKNRGTLEAAKAAVEKHLGTVEVSTNVAGAELLVNGRAAGTLPHAPLRVEAGTVMLDVRAAGYAPARRLVDVPSGGVARETFTLVSFAPIALPAAPAPAAPAGGAPAKEAPAPEASPARRTWGYVALGGAAVFLGVAVAETIDRNTRVDSYNGDGACLQGDQKPQWCVDEKSAAQRAEVISIVGYSLAGLSAATGVWLLATSGSSPAKTSLGVSVAPNAAWLRGTF